MEDVLPWSTEILSVVQTHDDRRVHDLFFVDFRVVNEIFQIFHREFFEIFELLCIPKIKKFIKFYRKWNNFKILQKIWTTDPKLQFKNWPKNFELQIQNWNF